MKVNESWYEFCSISGSDFYEKPYLIKFTLLYPLFNNKRTIAMTLVLFLLSGSYESQAQKPARWEVGGGLGPLGYLGDLNENDLVAREFNFSFQSFARRYVSDFFSVKSTLTMSQISGKDSYYSSRQSRNLEMDSPLVEFATVVEWDLFDMNPEYYRYKYRLRGISTPYFFAGIGGVYTSPGIDFSQTQTPYPSILEGIKKDILTPHSRYHVVFPLGVGYKYDITPCWGLSVEASFRVTMSDYIDGISFAGNPNKTDAYQMVTVSFMHRLGRYSCFPFKPMRNR